MHSTWTTSRSSHWSSHNKIYTTHVIIHIWHYNGFLCTIKFIRSCDSPNHIQGALLTDTCLLMKRSFYNTYRHKHFRPFNSKSYFRIYQILVAHGGYLCERFFHKLSCKLNAFKFQERKLSNKTNDNIFSINTQRVVSGVTAKKLSDFSYSIN